MVLPAILEVVPCYEACTVHLTHDLFRCVDHWVLDLLVLGLVRGSEVEGGFPGHEVGPTPAVVSVDSDELTFLRNCRYCR